MNPKFEIEAKWKTGKGKHMKHFVFARCLDKEVPFSVTDNSRLNDIEISNYLNQPRAIDQEGNPRVDIFAFKIRYKKEYNKLENSPRMF